MALVLAGSLGGLAGYAYYAFLQCDWMVYGYDQTSLWTAAAGYTVSQWVYFWVATYCLPIAVIFLVSFASASFHALPRTSPLKLTIYYVIFSLLVVAIAFSYILSSDVLHCISYLCVSSVADSAPQDDDGLEGTIKAGQIFVGMLYFFIADFFLIVFTTYIVIAHMDISSSSKDSESTAAAASSLAELGSDPLHPLFPMSLALVERNTATEKDVAGGATVWRDVGREDARAPLIVRRPGAAGAVKGEPLRLYSPSPTNQLWATAALLLVLMPLLIFACCALPTWWAYFTRTGIQSYQADRPSQSYGTYWAVTLGGGSLVLKLFPDIVMFYGAIYLVAATALLSKVYRPLASLLHARPVSSLPYLSVGDLLVGSLVAALLAGVFAWFYLQHGWEQSAVTSRSNNERAARSMGQVANVVAGLLVLPVTRNSAWTWMLSLSREAVLLYHQIMGYALLVVIGAHMVLWWFVFIEQNSFPHDILAVPLEYHEDNFTVPLAQVTYICMLVIFGVLTYSTIRRRHYRLFYYLHLFSMVVFLVMLWHATMSWYFLLGGLFLWTVDWYLRLAISAATVVKVRTLQVELPPKLSSGGTEKNPRNNPTTGAVISLRYSASLLNTGPLQTHPGQYMYINIPQISPHDWHPFSLASVPGDDECQHLVRVVGGDASWTSRLFALAAAAPNPADVVVNVEGPYGLQWDGPAGSYGEYASVVLIAGGIGITALLPVFRQLQLTAKAAPGSVLAATAVTLVWVVSCEAEAKLAPVAQHLAAAAAAAAAAVAEGGDSQKFSVITFVTGSATLSPLASEPDDAKDERIKGENLSESKSKAKSAQPALPFPHRAGRPDLPSLLKSLAPVKAKGASMLVHVCGPDGLVDSAAAAAATSGAHFRREAFSL